jgi:3-dehydroquinate synthase
MTDWLPDAVPPAHERTGAFKTFAKTLRADAVVFADRRVLRLHPKLKTVLSRVRVVALPAGEATKSLETVERVARRLQDVSRSATFVALGGGTIGDVVSVIAHLHKRGVRLIHVPTTLLAAVDSSIGGKGAVNVGGVKNALGVFHGSAETWLCPEFFGTLSEAQRREGRLEAWKMVVTLDGPTFHRWSRKPPDDAALLRIARGLKEAVVRRDPFERNDLRVVLNFGHTFGHVLESLSGYSLAHGEAVGVGMLCALDVGVALGVTPRGVAVAVEAALPNRPRARGLLAKLASKTTISKVQTLLAADKKSTATALRMVLLESPGTWRVTNVETSVWQRAWKGEWSVRV